MLTLISASVTLVNLLLSLAIGCRLFRLAWRERGFGPVFWLAVFFVFSAFLGAGLNISVYAGLADPALALGPVHGPIVLAVSCSCYAVGTLGLHLFNWMTFRRDSNWAYAGVAAGGLLVVGTIFAQGLTEGFAVRVLPGPAYWAFFAARVAPFYWLAGEALRYYALARRRVRIGLADPLVTNRFLLLGLWAAAWAGMGLSEVVARGLYVMTTGESVELRLDAAGPIILVTIAVTSLLGGLAAVTLALSFFPTGAYRRFVLARSAPR
jgi:hypothetical protein